MGHLKIRVTRVFTVSETYETVIDAENSYAESLKSYGIGDAQEAMEYLEHEHGIEPILVNTYKQFECVNHEEIQEI